MTNDSPLLADRIDGPFIVIGDLHGAVGPLQRLLDRLRQLPDFADRWVVFTGDFPDRWTDPKGGVDMVLDLLGRHRKVTACMGNHDLALLGATGLVATPPSSNWDLRYIADYNSWPTFASYGVSRSVAEFDDLADAVEEIQPYYDPTDPLFSAGVVPAHLEALRARTCQKVTDVLARLRDNLPHRHRAFLTALPWRVEHPDHIIVHAGLTAQPFETQLGALRQRDFSLSRPPWLHDQKLARAPVPNDCPRAVVSGHTVVPEVQFLQDGRRILVDTHNGPGTVLSAVLLPERAVITSAGP